MRILKNFVGGEWRESTRRPRPGCQSRGHDRGGRGGARVHGRRGRPTPCDGRAARVRGLAADARAGARADPLQGPAAHGRAPAGTRRGADPGGGQDARRIARRDPARDQRRRVLRRRGAADHRRDDSVGAAEQLLLHAEAAGRAGGGDHALELPDRDPDLEDRAGARLGQHRRLQAGDA